MPVPAKLNMPSILALYKAKRRINLFSALLALLLLTPAFAVKDFAMTGPEHGAVAFPGVGISATSTAVTYITSVSQVINNSVADGSSQDYIEILVTDQATGLPVSGVNVNFYVTGGINPVSTTNAAGKAYLYLTSSVITTFDVSAKVAGVLVPGSPVSLSFVAGPVSAANSSLSLGNSGAVADNVQTNSVAAHITDAYGNPVSGQTVSFAIQSGVAGFSGGVATAVTDASGNATITLVSTVAGPVAVTATVGGNPIITGSPVTVVFVAGPPDASMSSLVVVVTGSAADGATKNTIHAHIVDKYGNTVAAGQSVTFSIAGGTAAASAFLVQGTTVMTDAIGNATLDITDILAGTVQLKATVVGTNIPNGSPATVTFVASTPAVANPLTQLSTVTTGAAADGAAKNRVKAHIVDANGNPVGPGQAVIFSVAGGTAGVSAVLVGGTTVTTDANGDAFLDITDIAAGTVQLTATVNGNTIINGSPATVNFVAAAPSTANPATQLSTVTTGAVADGVAKNRVKAHIVDANGNPVGPGQAVIFSVAGGTAGGSAVLVGGATVTTDANGDAFLDITDIAAGTVLLTATVNGNNIPNGSPVKVTFVASTPAVSNPQTQLSTVTTGAVADGAAKNRVQAHIVDVNGNPVGPGQTVVFSIAGGTAGGSAVLVGGATATTDASGNAYLDITDIAAGTVLLAAAVNGNNIPNGSPATVTFVANAPDVANAQTRLIVDITGSVADGVASNKVHAHIVDANGNPVPAQTVTFTVSGGSAGASAVLSAITVTTDANGNAYTTITDLTPGTVQLSADVNGVAIINGSPAGSTFVIGPPDVTKPATQLIVDINNAVANGISTNKVHAHIVDAAGNAVAAQTVVFTVAGGAAGATAVLVGGNTVTTDVNGDAYITITDLVAGAVQLTATVNGVAIINNSPANVVFIAGPPDLTNPATKLVVDVTGALANGVATNKIHAHVADANGNPVGAGVTVNFSIGAGGAGGTAAFLGGIATATTDANGDATITLTNTVSGSVDLSATIGGIAITNNSPATVLFTDQPDPNNPATALIVIANNALADGLAQNAVKAHVVDQNGNVLQGRNVSFRIESGNAQILTVQPVVTDVSGDAVIELASKKSGNVSVTAKVNGISIVNGSPAILRFIGMDIYVPKVFTPNGDGTNDVLKPIIPGIATFHYFNVYNRWGNLIFTTQDANAGWDGRWNGVPQPVETYIWSAEGLDNDGNKIVRRGMVSLVR